MDASSTASTALALTLPPQRTCGVIHVVATMPEREKEATRAWFREVSSARAAFPDLHARENELIDQIKSASERADRERVSLLEMQHELDQVRRRLFYVELTRQQADEFLEDTAAHMLHTMVPNARDLRVSSDAKLLIGAATLDDVFAEASALLGLHQNKLPVLKLATMLSSIHGEEHDAVKKRIDVIGKREATLK